MQQGNNQEVAVKRIPEARYAYYRRCQLFRKNGEQCKAPAEKGAHICHAHAGEQAMALRRRLELMVVLAEAVRRMRARGKPEFEVADIFMDFNAIQITLAVMAQALIDRRIDCKTAGRLAVGLQTAAKLLRIVQRKRQQILPQIGADDRRLKKVLTTKDTKEHEGISGDLAIGRPGHRSSVDREAPLELSLIRRGENASFVGVAGTLKQERGTLRNGSAHSPPEWARAA